MDSGKAWASRANCCKSLTSPDSFCSSKAMCWVPDTSASPSRVCKTVTDDNCPDWITLGQAYAGQPACCSNAFGKGLTCRKFPSQCYMVNTATAKNPSGYCSNVVRPATNSQYSIALTNYANLTA